MRPKTSESEGHQLELGAVLLESFINMKDELVILGKVIDWKHFGKKFGESFHERQGRPGLPTRLMVGLTYLKYLHNLSDEREYRKNKGAFFLNEKVSNSSLQALNEQK